MQTLEKALENLVHNMEILRDTLNKQHQAIENFTDTLDFIRDDISELDTKISFADTNLALPFIILTLRRLANASMPDDKFLTKLCYIFYFILFPSLKFYHPFLI